MAACAGAPSDGDASLLADSPPSDAPVQAYSLQPMPVGGAPPPSMPPPGVGQVQVAQAVPAGGYGPPGLGNVPRQPPPGLPPGGSPPTKNAYQGGAYQRAGPGAETAGRSSGSAPVLCDAVTGANFPLERLRVNIDVHMASMFVTVVGSWTVGSRTTGLFKMPTAHKATITGCSITIGTRMMRTAVIDAEDASKYGGGGGGGGSSAAVSAGSELADVGKYDPSCFRMPIPDLKPGEVVELQVSYYEMLDYIDGQYIVAVPMAFDAQSLAGRRLESLADLSCKINAGCPSCTLGSCTHPYSVQNTAGETGVVSFVLDKSKPWSSGSFEVQYCVGAQEILANLLCDTLTQSFSMVVAPPPADKIVAQYSKHIMFIIDRSGSMYGQPIANAKAALKEAVLLLNEGDYFNIIQYDHEQILWSPEPFNASESNKQQACAWIDSITARGLTDILTPLKSALAALESMPVNTAAGANVPFVFLITDGCVRDEREICHYLAETRRRTRIMTLGIGEYCNHYFLQMMAMMGHGFCEIALEPDKIYRQITHLVEMANTPVLTDVSIEIDGVDDCELYPFPIPDLFLGAPLILSGQYGGSPTFPQTVSLTGTLATGQQYQTQVPVSAAGAVPVERVFLKQRLEILTAKGWLQDSEQIMQQVVALSTAASMPCAHTTMIAFETTPEKLAKHQKKHGGGEGGELFESEKGNQPGVKGRKGLSNATIGALAVGGTIVVVGASAAAFGDLAATIGNVGAFGAIGDALGGGDLLGGGDIGGDMGGDVDGDGCCDDGCCDGCECDDCCDGCDCTVQ